jgi:hypothetical protein
MSDVRALFLHLLSKYSPLTHPVLVVRAVEEVLWEGSLNDEEKVTVSQWLIGQFTNGEPAKDVKNPQA